MSLRAHDLFSWNLSSCTADCPISYLVSASDVLSNVGVSHHVSGSQSSASLEQDVVSFNSIWCDQPPAVGNNVMLNFSERVLINRIRVNGKQSAFVSNFTLLIQENSADTHNQFDRVSPAGADRHQPVFTISACFQYLKDTNWAITV